MFWSLLTIAVGVYAGLCLVFLLFQRSFIYMPTPVTPTHAQAFPLEVPGATVPELAELFSDRAIYGMHYRGYSGSSGRPGYASLRRFPPLRVPRVKNFLRVRGRSASSYTPRPVRHISTRKERLRNRIRAMLRHLQENQL